MDWRAISRSRSRAPMDWRPESRSRSRPPMNGMSDSHNQFKFPSSPPKRESGIPIPSSSGHRSPQAGLPAVYESTGEHRAQLSALDSFALLHSPAGHPSSLPSTGLLARAPGSGSTLPSPEMRAFPKHVRKTSFDHTVAREGIFTGVSGRHQVNGKPRSPESLVGTKRRADAPHAESMLRGDPPSGMDLPPSAVDAKEPEQHPYHHHQQHHQMRRESPFPSSAFNFSVPAYEPMFDLGPHPLGPHLSSSLPAQKEHPLSDLQFSDVLRGGPLGGTYSPPHEGLSAAAAASAAAVADSYAFGMASMALPEYQLLDMVYPGSGPVSGGMGGGNPFTVDPTQILPNVALEHADAVFHPSPSSDGWGNGVGSSSNASPEPYNVSNASTPPSTAGGAGTTRPAQSRKIASTKRVTQDGAGRAGGSGAQRKG